MNEHHSSSEETSMEELLLFMEQETKNILIIEYKLDEKQAISLFQSSSLVQLIKKIPTHVLHNSPHYWAAYIYEEVMKG